MATALLASAYGAGSPVVAGFLTAKEKAAEFERLKKDIVQSNDYIAWVKSLIDQGLAQSDRVIICSLPELADAVNFYQNWYHDNFVGTLNRGFHIAWPEYYRFQLGRVLAVVQQQVARYTFEVLDHGRKVWEETLRSGPVDEKSVRAAEAKIAERTDCKRLVETWSAKSRRAPKGWDICPNCGRHLGATESNLSEYYKSFNDPSKFLARRETIERERAEDEKTFVRSRSATPAAAPTSTTGRARYTYNLRPRRKTKT